MLDTLTRYLEAMKPADVAYTLRRLLLPPIDPLPPPPLTAAGLEITGAGGVTAKIGAADFYAAVQGKLVKVAAGTSMPALTGFNFGAGAFNVACFYVNGAGVLTMLPGSQGATLGAVTLPVPALNCALVGLIIVTYASAFTGGTTPLDTATTVYVSPLGGFDPSALTG